MNAWTRDGLRFLALCVAAGAALGTAAAALRRPQGGRSGKSVERVKVRDHLV